MVRIGFAKSGKLLGWPLTIFVRVDQVTEPLAEETALALDDIFHADQGEYHLQSRENAH